MARCRHSGHWHWDQNFMEDEDEIVYLIHTGFEVGFSDTVRNKQTLTGTREVTAEEVDMLTNTGGIFS
eukprot:5073328-Alexandrium_andersonii.AAC.1